MFITGTIKAHNKLMANRIGGLFFFQKEHKQLSMMKLTFTFS